MTLTADLQYYTALRRIQAFGLPLQPGTTTAIPRAVQSQGVAWPLSASGCKPQAAPNAEQDTEAEASMEEAEPASAADGGSAAAAAAAAIGPNAVPVSPPAPAVLRPVVSGPSCLELQACIDTVALARCVVWCGWLAAGLTDGGWEARARQSRGMRSCV